MSVLLRGRVLRGLAIVAVLLVESVSPAADWPQWCGTDGKNMVSTERDLPDSFVPGQKDSRTGKIDLATAKNVKWGHKICDAIYSTPVIAGGRIFFGGARGELGVLVCLDERTGNLLWQWEGPSKEVPYKLDGFDIGISVIPRTLGICSSPRVEGDRVYFVTHDFKVLCLDAAGRQGGKAKIVWSYDMWERLGVFPCDAVNGSPVIDGDLLYVQTSNGIDHNMDPYKEKYRKLPAPNAPNVIVLRKNTGRLVATDDAPIAAHMLHGQWSSLSLGELGGRKLVFFGGGDGRCYAFEALRTVPKPGAHSVKLKTVWSYDCNPAEYKSFGGLDWVTHYCTGDKRRRNGNNTKNDGTFVGMSEIIATPVLYKNRIYVAIGRDPEHGRGRGALHCIDATQSGDITKSGRIWSYQGLDRTLSTVSIAGGLLYICDVAGRLHCLDAETGQLYWTHASDGPLWGSTLVADGKVFMPTAKGLLTFAAGKQEKVLSQVKLGAPLYASPIAANGTMYIVTKTGWIFAVARQ
jgi:outer membrane protein assembly factor BamB